MSKAKKIDRYVEAVRARKALSQAIRDDGHTPERDRALADAWTAETEALRCLTGGEMSCAQKILRGGPTV